MKFYIFFLISILGLINITLFARESVITTTKDIIAIGDVHGDLDNLLQLLKRINIIDDNRHWIAPNTILVQLGDQIDRGNQDKAVIDFFKAIKQEAPSMGGAVYEVLGNHEAYNILLNFKYVAINDDFLSYYHPPLSLPTKCQEYYQTNTIPWFDTPYFRDQSLDGDPVPLAIRGRAATFCPGGEYAKIMSEKYVTLIVNKTLFVHAEVTPKYSKMKRSGLHAINEEVSAWAADSEYQTQLYKDIRAELLSDQEGPVKSRFFSKDFSEEKCSVLAEVLNDLGVDRMVVGHTIQPLGITSDCNGKIFRVDTGYSSGFFHFKWVQAPKEAIKIHHDQVIILKDEPWIQLFNKYQEDILNSTIDCKMATPIDTNRPYSMCPRELAHIAFNYLAKIDDVYKDTVISPDRPWQINSSYQFESDLPPIPSVDSCFFRLVDKIVVLEGKVKCNLP
ncbi:MAG: hypothetical protein A2381_05430 [Bdellovibrionales bacterium RIFOXYB1_FULL_37_110]|nr:MAG: hypothetical protein A2417_16910 [Bdellovibrionales bacterium RIFOXYC1_FULL_37_79]OFZ58188.1 MAG: hypothetical protein A2381_05430 [Bdellovibrionales bacterium RIFOXYB1_FULL_37_110]OFZ61877.1 MAG: hypothetical protein A2577_19015 [Bdellovibrionales bacterium RIFOXYD1_FULL_36_51]